MGSEMCIRDRYHAGKKTGKTDNDVMVDDIVAAVEAKAEVLKAEVAEAAE